MPRTQGGRRGGGAEGGGAEGGGAVGVGTKIGGFWEEREGRGKDRGGKKRREEEWGQVREWEKEGNGGIVRG